MIFDIIIIIIIMEKANFMQLVRQMKLRGV
jgi:hypothetical protein